MRMRWGAYAGVSVALAGGVIVKALAQRPNFYSAAVYLAASNANLMILTNLVFVAACTLLLSLQKLLYGPLRPIEIEQLYEKAWFAVTETCLAMTIFRGEIGAWFLVMFFALLTGKVWGWIAEGRVEILEQQPPANPRLFHTRMAISLLLSVLYDTWMLEYVVKEVLDMARPDMMVMFGFEFAVLSVLSLSTLARYGISLVEILIIRGQKFRRAEEIRKERRDAIEAEQRALIETVEGTQHTTSNAPQASTAQVTPTPTTALAIPDEPIDESELEVEGWEEKGRWIFYLDLMTDFFKLVIYLSFFFILLVFYGLPIHIMRDVFLTCRSFFKRIGDFLRYRTATRDMNERYPDATAEEVGREDVCIICREDMRVMPRTDTNAADGTAPQQARQPNPVAERMRPKKLPCGHVLHFSCLRSWLERQQICPTCRQPVLPRGHHGAAAGAAGGAGGAFAQAFADGANDARRQLEQNPAQRGQAANANDGHADEQNPRRGRVFQLGPLRLFFAAGRGLGVEDLAQRGFLDGDAAQGQNGQAGNQQNQFGFGFGFGRPNRRTTHRSTNVQADIDRAERHIQREIEGLRALTTELNLIRQMQAELTRLRALRDQLRPNATDAVPAGGASAVAQPPPQPQPTAIPSMTGLVADSRQNALAAGNEALPPGLTLPEGWTMMPLQRMQPGTQIPSMGTAFAQPASSGFGGAAVQIPLQAGPLQDLLQAMQALPGMGQMPHLQPGQQIQQPNGILHQHHHHPPRPEVNGGRDSASPTIPNGAGSAATTGTRPAVNGIRPPTFAMPTAQQRQPLQNLPGIDEAQSRTTREHSATSPATTTGLDGASTNPEDSLAQQPEGLSPSTLTAAPQQELPAWGSASNGTATASAATSSSAPNATPLPDQNGAEERTATTSNVHVGDSSEARTRSGNAKPVTVEDDLEEMERMD